MCGLQTAPGLILLSKPCPGVCPPGDPCPGGALPQGFKHDPAHSAELPLGPLCPPSTFQPGFAAWVPPHDETRQLAATFASSSPISHLPPRLLDFSQPAPPGKLAQIRSVLDTCIGAGYQYGCWMPPCATGHSRMMPGVPAVHLHHYFGGVHPACCSQTVSCKAPCL